MPKTQNQHTLLYDVVSKQWSDVSDVTERADDFQTEILACEVDTVVGSHCKGLLLQAEALLAMCEEPEVKKALRRAVVLQCEVWMFG